MADIQKNKRRKKQSKENEFLIQGAILAAAAVIVKIIGALYRIPLTNIIGDEGNGFLGYAYEIYGTDAVLLQSSDRGIQAGLHKDGDAPAKKRLSNF
jgi:stage V sporulation protein B